MKKSYVKKSKTHSHNVKGTNMCARNQNPKINYGKFYGSLIFYLFSSNFFFISVSKYQNIYYNFTLPLLSDKQSIVCWCVTTRRSGKKNMRDIKISLSKILH